MSGMTDYQRKCALRAIDNLLSHTISKMFSEPVDTKEFPKYLEIISKPMDLGTIRRKILHNEYPNIQEFKQDVQLVWENTKKFNGKHSIIAGLAKTLQYIFKEETEFLTGNDANDWQKAVTNAAETIQIKLNIIIKTQGGITSSIVSSARPVTPERKPPTRSSSRKLTPAIQHDYEVGEIAADDKPVRTDRKKITRASSSSAATSSARKIQKKKAPAAVVEEVRVVIPPIEELPRYEDKPLTFEEQKQLIIDIGKVTKAESEFYEEQIIQCISDFQPELVKNNEVNTSIDKLYDSTLIRLRKIVNDIMKHLSL
jgi:hypothetical protein